MLALGILLIVGNTIRLGIESQREEIGIIRLFGATNAFIRRPFLYIGLWLGLIAGGVACLLAAERGPARGRAGRAPGGTILQRVRSRRAGAVECRRGRRRGGPAGTGGCVVGGEPGACGEVDGAMKSSVAAVDAMRQGLALKVVERLELYLYHHAAAVVALTHSLKYKPRDARHPSEKFAVIMNGVDSRVMDP